MYFWFIEKKKKGMGCCCVPSEAIRSFVLAEGANNLQFREGECSKRGKMIEFGIAEHLNAPDLARIVQTCQWTDHYHRSNALLHINLAYITM